MTVKPMSRLTASPLTKIMISAVALLSLAPTLLSTDLRSIPLRSTPLRSTDLLSCAWGQARAPSRGEPHMNPAGALPSCASLRRATREAITPQLAHEYMGLKRSLSALRSSAWTPRAPQLRGRVDRDQEAGASTSWSHRVGARLYLPALTADPAEVNHLGVSLSELPDAWRDARLREEEARVSALHITAREAWVELTAARERAHLSAQRHTISLELERSGALSARDLKRALLERELARLETRELYERWGALIAEVRALITTNHATSTGSAPRSVDHALNSALTPLKSACVTRPTSPEMFDERAERPRAISAREALLLFELNRRRVEVTRGSRRWLDFVEVSYDQREDASRWIAEIGIDLASLDPRDASDRLRRDQLQAELRAQSQESTQAEMRLRAQLRFIYAEGPPRASSITLKRPELRQLPDLDLYALEVTLWERSWRRALSAERALIMWRALQRAE